MLNGKKLPARKKAQKHFKTLEKKQLAPVS